MKLHSAKFSNFRLLRNLEINFSTDSEKPLTVIRAENEFGKTTILNALQWIIFGDDGLPRKGNDYRIYHNDLDNKPGSSIDITGELEFEHTFQHKTGDGSWVEKTCNYLARRTVTETIQSANRWQRDSDNFDLFQKDSKGITRINGGELMLKQILGSNLKDLFFTDGDRALSFITSEVSIGEKRKMVQKAIRDMLGFELLDNASTHVKKSIGTIRSQGKALPGSEEVNAAEQKHNQLTTKETEISTRLSEIDLELKQVEADIASAEQKIERALQKGNKEELIQQSQKLKKEHIKLTNQLAAIKNSQSESLYSEDLAQALLARQIKSARQLLDDTKEKGGFPRTAIPILKEILEIKKCICGEILKPGSPQWNHIEKLIKQQQEESVIDDRLIDLRLIARQKNEWLENTDNNWISKIKSVLQKREQCENDITIVESEEKQIETKINQLPATDIGFHRDQRKKLMDIRDGLNKEQSQLTADLDRVKKAKKVANDEFEIATARHKRFKQIKSRLDATEDILSVILTSYKDIEDLEIPRVSQNMNEYFLDMIQADPENSMIRKAEVTPAYDIAVFGPKDWQLDADLDLNGASQRALTISFILALTEVSGVTAPNIIDTPLGMTSGIIKQMILETAVKHTAQLILFLTRAEISGCEDLLDRYAGEIFTITNTAQYPKILVNDPKCPIPQVLRCNCNHRQFCHQCEIKGDSRKSYLSKNT